MCKSDIINRNFRANDIARWRNMDFVVGYTINISNTPSEECNICKLLAGNYPKTFKWTGWHDGCKCFITPIMEDYFSKERSNDRVNQLKAALNGKEYLKRTPKDMVIYVPEVFMVWFASSAKKMKKENKYPDFVINNINIIKSSYEYYKNTCQ